MNVPKLVPNNRSNAFGRKINEIKAKSVHYFENRTQC